MDWDEDFMAKLIVSLFCLFSFKFASAHWMLAQTMPPWQKVSERNEVATEPKEFLELQSKYPYYFEDYDGSTVVSAFMITTIWEYKGRTRCRKLDPRLRQKTFYYGLCERDENDTGMCYSQANALPAEDPCGKKRN